MDGRNNTSKKNQHFVPRFYLKQFSVNGNGKEISLYNKKYEKFVLSASLYNQASGKFYYGEDGLLEDDLAKSESIFAKVIQQIIKTETLPKHGSYEHRQILHFAVMTEYRNPVKKKEMEQLTDIMSEYMKQHANFPEKYRTENYSIKLRDPVATALMNHHKNVLMISDLHIKLFINITNRPFITSDNPIVQYNQFLEQKTKLPTNTGYGIKGIQIFIPISPRLMLLIFDSQIYYVGKKRSKHILISNLADIDQLNLLQMVNSNQSVYANEKIEEKNLQMLLEKNKEIKEVGQPISHKVKVGENSFLVHHGQTSCKIGLNLAFIYFSTHAGNVPIVESQLVYPRDYALEVADALENDIRFKR